MVQLGTLTLGSHRTPGCRWMGTLAPESCTGHAPPPLLPWVLRPGRGHGTHHSVLVQGLGLVVTGTLPVFNLTEDSSDRKVGDSAAPALAALGALVWGHCGVGKVSW